MNLNNPSDVSVYSDGTVYVLDSQNYRISKWEPGAITINGNQFDYSSRFSVDTNGNIYVLNQYNHQIQKWTKRRRIMDNCCRRKWRRLNHKLSPQGFMLMQLEIYL
jgi:hypothetical protein